MIKVNESVAHDDKFASECRENYGRDYQVRISRKTAAQLCGMYPLPGMGYETVVAFNPTYRSRLYVVNLGGEFVLRSCDWIVGNWPHVFGVSVTRKAAA